MEYQVELELSTACSHRCIHCYLTADALRNRASVFNSDEYCESLLSALRQLRVREVILTGGEPTIHRNFARIVGPLATEGKSVVLFTNGIRGRGFWVDQGFPTRSISIEVSLYGFTEQTYERFTGNRAGLRRAIGFIEEARQRGVRCMVKVPNVSALSQEIRQIVRWGARLGVEVRPYSVVLLPRSIDPHTSRHPELVDSPPPGAVDAKALQRYATEACGAGVTSFRITAAGNVLACQIGNAGVRCFANFNN